MAADLKVIFRNFEYFGLVTIVEPPSATINKAVPIRMQMLLSRDFNYLGLAQGVVLHEFGHVLCVGNHSECGDLHIMKLGAHYVPLPPAIPSLDTQGEMEAAISDDEVRLVRYIRNLPQGINMNQYLLN